MSIRYIIITLGLVGVLLFASACVPSLSEYAQDPDKNGTGDQTYPEDGVISDQDGVVSSDGANGQNIVSSADAASSEPGSSDSAVGEADQTELGLDGIVDYDTAAWSRFEDKNYKFAVLYDPRLTAKMLDKDALSKLIPSPQAAFEFRDTASELGDLEMPVFTVRFFENPTNQTVDAWVNGLKLSSDSWLVEAYKSDTLTGVKVMSTSYIAAGWAVFTNHGKYIVQLTPLGIEGEAMLGTFELMK